MGSGSRTICILTDKTQIKCSQTVFHAATLLFSLCLVVTYTLHVSASLSHHQVCLFIKTCHTALIVATFMVAHLKPIFCCC
jgi:hypothetical protein